MRVLYKALASVGMVALSTAAAFGVRYLAKRSKAKKEAQNPENTQELTESENTDTATDCADAENKEADQTDTPKAENTETDNESQENVVIADVEIQKDVDDSAKESE